MISSIVTRTISVILVSVTISFNSYSQALDDFKQRLDEADNVAEFDRAFGKMIDAYRAEKIVFQDADVTDIVRISREKSFAAIILPKVYGWAGNMFGDGRMEEAITFFMESAVLYQKQQKHLAESLCYYEVALIQHKAENFDEADEYYNKALATGNDSLDHRIRINCYNGLALIDREEGHYEAAERQFRNAFRIAVQNKDTAWIAILSGNIGSVHLRQSHFDSALFYYSENMRFVKKAPEVENQIEAYAHLARTHIGKKNPKVAVLYLDSAVALAQRKKMVFNDFFNPMDYIHESYALAYAAQGKYQLAFEHQQKYQNVYRDKQRRINSRSLRQIQLTEAFRKKQNELELLQQVNKANLETIRQQTFTQIGFLSVILLLSAFGLIMYRTGKQRKRLNKELSQSNAELERLNTIKNKLFSVISHDLRSPLNSLHSALDLFKSGDLKNDELMALSEKISHHVKVSGDVLENLLQWAKFELSEIGTNPSSVTLREVINRVTQQFNDTLAVKSITLENNIPVDHEALADENQIEIVFRNLVGNAIKFTGANGWIKIGSTQTKTHIQISVEDTGRGMSAEKVSKLFLSEFKHSTPGTNEEKGTGIGLLICREMVRNNNGTIEVTSTEGTGTTFRITLPKG